MDTMPESTPTPKNDAIVRPARRDESDALAELYASVSMDGDLRIAVERTPDFFGFYDIECPTPDQHVVVLERDGQLQGVAACLARDAYLRGERVRTGYLTDLRFAPGARGGHLLGKVYAEVFPEFARWTGADLFYTVVFDSNRAGRKALVERNSRFPDKPIYTPVRGFSISSVFFASWRPVRPSAFTVRIAGPDDVGRMVEHLQDDHRTRPFGYVFDEGLLERRLRDWPRFGLERFYLVEDKAGRLRGMGAVWDPQDVKRFRVLGYEGSMKWVRRTYDPLARLLRGQPLPPPGEILRYFYLSHVSIKDDDPAVMAALADRVYADFYGRGYAFFSVYLEKDDPLRRAFRTHLVSGLDATLYAVHRPGSRYEGFDFGPGRSGFEMALA